MRQQPSREYRGYRTAGIRMSEELAPEFSHGREQDERAALYATHMYDKAHVLMLTERQLVPSGAGEAMLRAFRALEAEEGGAVEARIRVGGGMHSGEQYLIRLLGEDVGGWDHVGRSSACLAVVGRRIMQRDALLETFGALAHLRRTLLELAAQHLDTVVPGYFRSQLVQPTSFGHYLLGVAERLARDAQRAREIWSRVNLNPGGGVVLTGTAFAIDRERVADLLGFDGVVANAADAILNNDTAIECFAFLAILADGVSRLTRDLDRWAASENRVLDVADRYGAGSSLAMNMKTPLFPGIGLDTNALGDLVKSFSAAGTLGAINPDAPLKGIAGVLRVYANVLETVRIDTDRAREAATGPGYSGGTDLGVMLVQQCGLPWRTAHQICGILFRHCAADVIMPAQITGAMLDEAAIEYFGKPLGLSTEDVQRAMDPERILAARSHSGSSGSAAMACELSHLRQGLADDQAWEQARRSSLAAASAQLEEAIDKVVAA